MIIIKVYSNKSSYKLIIHSKFQAIVRWNVGYKNEYRKSFEQFFIGILRGKSRIQSNLLTNPYVNVFAFPYIDEITGSSCKYSV